VMGQKQSRIDQVSFGKSRLTRAALTFSALKPNHPLLGSAYAVNLYPSPTAPVTPPLYPKSPVGDPVAAKPHLDPSSSPSAPAEGRGTVTLRRRESRCLSCSACNTCRGTATQRLRIVTSAEVSHGAAGGNGP
jgi:hypothetical protein